MNDSLKKLTEEFRTNLAAKVADQTVLEVIKKTKAAADDASGTFKVIISTADFDRQGWRVWWASVLSMFIPQVI